ncbi:MAG: hypothetical protein ACRCX2_22050 [Paraclostridium sp.]
MENIVLKYNEGKSLNTIANEMSMTLNTLKKLMSKNQIKIEARNKKTVFSVEKLKSALSMYESGVSLSKTAASFGTNRRTLVRMFELNDIDIKKTARYGKQSLFNLNKNIFEVIDTEEKAYWLGFLLADGYISKSDKNEVSLTLCELDKKHVIKFAEFIGRSEDGVKYRVKTKAYRFSFNDKKIKQDLAKHGVYNNKSLTCDLNKKIMEDEELKWHYLRGLFDGDGHLASYGVKKNRFLYIMNGSFEVIKALCTEIKKYTGLNKEPRKTKSKCFEIRLYGSNSDFILRKMYEGSKIHLERKKEKYIAVRGRS